MRPRFAQTVLELYQQLDQSGWSGDDQAGVARSYQFATQTMGAALRPSGKHFLHHVVGTASIVVWMGQPSVVAQAALLHAIYRHGDWGLISDPRSTLRRHVGDNVEELTWRYSNLEWNAGVVEGLAKGAIDIESVDPTLLRMRLANHLEDHLDRGMLYYPGGSAKEGKPVPLGSELIAIARTIGENQLAEAFEATFEEEREGRVPDVLRSRSANVTYVPPLTTMLEPKLWLRTIPEQHLAAGRRRVRRTMRSLGLSCRSLQRGDVA